ncbi:imidazole glycerol phosphate synthase subunit HisF [Helicobacter anatolicus]|uniref:imidazole glycerol phosphate synthase subunit HisF n=1 Tax=Helicobacter anatolicus TaxID=2905874 RepID=UPI001E5AAEA2|nr:imidazole glycerol phosphate synthase subunit HisF [Helicobacter anatolicus]MCE3038721.1 imidazole glycerol phosphate synthase subunit HisF [Helicobacter anatolicus]
MQDFAKRIIPCLDIKEGRVVKGVNFEGLREMGDPVALAKKYSDMGADELVLLDISASLEKRSIMLDVVKKVSREVFIPLSVGGGISSLEDINCLLDSGVDKVSLNSFAIKNPEFITQSAKKFGSQCIIIAIDVKKTMQTKSGWSVFVKGGSEDTHKDLGEWISEVCNRGAGEILLTSMDCDGVKQGFDIECLEFVKKLASVPVIASGGAGKMKDFLEIFQEDPKGECLADAGLAASIFHQDIIKIPDLKAYLQSQKIPVRI